MNTIWRVENRKGKGCYFDTKTIKILRKHLNRTHPIPLLDKDIKRSLLPEEICGFLTKGQAFKWFTRKELHSLKRLGYKLKQVSVRKITKIGKKQILAIR